MKGVATMAALLLAFSSVVSGQPPAAPPASAPARIGGTIRPPERTRYVEPAYPDEARLRGLRGVVVLELEIDVEGKVHNPRVLRSIPGLDEAALEAVRQWEYSPTLLNGVQTPVIMTVTVNFGPGPGVPGAGGAIAWFSTASGSGDMSAVRTLLDSSVGVLLPLEIAGTPDGGFYRWQVTREQVEQLAPWTSHSAPVPLEPARAIELAEAWLRERHDDIDTLTLGALSLKQIRGLLAADRWYYRVDFDPVVAGHRLPGQGHFTVVVLLDGSIVEPLVNTQIPQTGR